MRSDVINKCEEEMPMNNEHLNDAGFTEIHRGIAQMLKSDLRALTNAAWFCSLDDR